MRKNNLILILFVLCAASVFGATCNNEVCELGEDPISCPDDCYVSNHSGYHGHIDIFFPPTTPRLSVHYVTNDTMGMTHAFSSGIVVPGTVELYAVADNLCHAHSFYVDGINYLSSNVCHVHESFMNTNTMTCSDIVGGNITIGGTCNDEASTLHDHTVDIDAVTYTTNMAGNHSHLTPYDGVMCVLGVALDPSKTMYGYCEYEASHVHRLINYTAPIIPTLIQQFPDQAITQDLSRDINLLDYFNSSAPLQYTINNPSLDVTITIAGDTATITSTPGYVGIANVSIDATVINHPIKNVSGNYFIIQFNALPIFVENNYTTNFSAVPDITNVTNATIGNDDGQVQYEEPINATGANITGMIIITPKNITVETGANPNFNRSAILRFNNVTEIYPKLKKDGVECNSEALCKKIRYENGTLYFWVSGFSSYEVYEAYDPPDFSAFYNAWTTNFTNLSLVPDLTNVTDAMIGNDFGQIQYQEAINVSGANITRDVVIASKQIFVNSTANPELNKAAILRFNNVTEITPKLKKDGVACDVDCLLVNYTAGTLYYRVNGFSEYTVYEGYVAPPPGGGGGGGSTKKTVVVEVNWTCLDSYGPCVNGKQSYPCQSNTGLFEFRYRACIVEPAPNVEGPQEIVEEIIPEIVVENYTVVTEPVPEKKNNLPFMILGIVIVSLLIATGVMAIYSMKMKGKKEKEKNKK